MKSLTRCVGVLALAALGLMPLPPVWAQKKSVGAFHAVKDDAKMFSLGARERADDQIAALKKTYDKDLVIETLKAPKQIASIAADDKAAIDKAVDEYAAERFKATNSNGVYIMIIDSPKRLRVQVGNETRTQGYFTSGNREALINKMVEKLKHNERDEALLAATSFVSESIRTNHPIAQKGKAAAPVAAAARGGHAEPAARASGFPWMTLLVIIGIGLAVWVVFAMVRALFASRSGGYGPGGGGPGMGYGGGGGGGFMSNMLGGLVGAAAGMWMYNHFFGGGGSSAWAGGAKDNIGGAGDTNSYPDSSPADTSSTGAGADYGDDAPAGGDVGGGDWGGGGGGDVGGGDWGGGGGGDWGGGGGGGDW